MLQVMRAVRACFFQNPCDWTISLGELKLIGVRTAACVKLPD